MHTSHGTASNQTAHVSVAVVFSAMKGLSEVLTLKKNLFEDVGSDNVCKSLLIPILCDPLLYLPLVSFVVFTLDKGLEDNRDQGCYVRHSVVQVKDLIIKTGPEVGRLIQLIKGTVEVWLRRHLVVTSTFL